MPNTVVGLSDMGAGTLFSTARVGKSKMKQNRALRNKALDLRLV